MCEVCKNFEYNELLTNVNNGKYTNANELGCGRDIKLFLQENGKHEYKLVSLDIETNKKTEYVTYYCPTCGKFLG